MAAVPPPLGALEPYAHGSQVVLCAKVLCSCGQPYVHKRDSGTGHGWCTIATCHRSYGRKRAKQGLRPKPMPRFVVDDCLRGGSQVQGQAASASAPHRDLPPPPPVPTGFWLPTPTFPPKPPMPRPPTPPLAPEAEPEPEAPAPDSSQAIVIADSSQARASLQRAQLEQVACAQEEARIRILDSSRVAADLAVGEVVPDSRPGFERYDDDWSATQAWVQQHNMQVVNIEGQRMVLKLDQVAPRFFRLLPVLPIQLQLPIPPQAQCLHLHPRQRQQVPHQVPAPLTVPPQSLSSAASRGAPAAAARRAAAPGAARTAAAGAAAKTAATAAVAMGSTAIARNTARTTSRRGSFERNSPLSGWAYA